MKAASITRILFRNPPLLTLALVALVWIVAGATLRGFGAVGHLRYILELSAIIGIVAAGQTLVILVGGIDLSVEGNIALSAIVLSLVLSGPLGTLGLWAVPLAILAGAAMGAANGAAHVGLRIPSFMVTLGTWFVGLGLGTVLLGGGTIRIVEPSIRALSLTRFVGLPLLVWIAAAALLVAWVLQARTRFGRHVYAVGGAEDLAALSGIRVGRIKVLVFILAGAFYGLAAVMSAAQIGQGNAAVGDGRLFTTITAVVVGGTSLAGGDGGVIETAIGVLIVAVLANGMILLGIPPYVQQAVQGLMIIAAVAISIDHRLFRIVK